jgi:hypothetical protein
VRDRLPLVFGFALLGLAIGLGAVVLGAGIRDRGRNDTMTVTGSAKARIESDYVIWDASVASQADTPQAALPPLTRWSTQVRAYLNRTAEPGEISEGPITTDTLTNDAGRVTGYRLTRTFEVRSPRVPQIAALVRGSQDLLAEGVPLQAQPPQYLYTKLAQLRPKLLAAATRDALHRGKILVAATGATIAGLRGVDVSPFQVTAPNSTQVEDYGAYDTSTRAKDVTAVVNVTLGLQ